MAGLQNPVPKTGYEGSNLEVSGANVDPAPEVVRGFRPRQ